MKGKKLKSKGTEMGATSAVIGSETPPSSEPTPSANLVKVPTPEYLLERARGEPNHKLLEEYKETIEELRNEKGFSFREISDWLTENGVEADYNAVYRVYTKNLSETEVGELDREEQEEEP